MVGDGGVSSTLALILKDKFFLGLALCRRLIKTNMLFTSEIVVIIDKTERTKSKLGQCNHAYKNNGACPIHARDYKMWCLH